jgi:iron complex outermembrane receptor protein
MPHRVPTHSRALAGTLLGAVLLVPGVAGAQGQGELRGRVLTDSGRAGVPDVRVILPRLGLEAVSDSAGNFRINAIRPGEYALVLRAVGFRPETTTVEIEPDLVIVRDYTLRPAVTSLPEQRIEGEQSPAFTGKMGAFNERRKFGNGYFIDRSMIAKDEERGMRTGDVFAKVPGVRVIRGQSKAWVASGRAINNGGRVFGRGSGGPSRADLIAGARPACYMDVYLDGVQLASGEPTDLFDVNSLQLSAIEGIEVYASASQVPAKYNKTGRGCGVMLIWTR